MMKNQPDKWSVYMMAGVASSPDFMNEFRDGWERRFQDAGHAVRVHIFYPYGDWSRSMVRQLREVRSDLMAGFTRRKGSVGGKRAYEAIKSSYDGGNLLIVGHSAGGLAGVHAAHMLAEEGHEEPVRVVKIGSPKCTIPLTARDSVLIVDAVDGRGKVSDPISRLGTWAGWERGRFGLPRRNSRLFAPASITHVSIVGGHADYFRSSHPFIGEDGQSNMQLVSDVIWSWLQPTGERIPE
ncbi:hypothetical protein [Paenibacillus sp. MBLB4367]|uniref:hypothetical protein n=1 Tax=Paenibacillus sp. MBLB4367 TaxID=3384767 RepID=UPI0039083B1F